MILDTNTKINIFINHLGSGHSFYWLKDKHLIYYLYKKISYLLLKNCNNDKDEFTLEYRLLANTLSNKEIKDFSTSYINSMYISVNRLNPTLE